ncbi:hypothetical protein OEZ85_008378 [Tetradesmus obliquus]|uniref:Uncharacterized protein n=1 Tax=Tetradesmus obliquus TaxID=3088 RepID=A0ABY8TKR4_TETOB|nr:hypothetical protein OEZ85_008378 [Tetradesmus obliquus]
MGRTVYFLLLVVFIGVAAHAKASAVPAITAPLFSWANEKYLSAAGQASRTSYQVYGDFSSTLKGLITSAVSHGSEIPSQLDWLDMQAVQQQGPEVVLVVLGNQLKTSHLRSKAAQSMLAPLQRLMDKAESSISVPYVMHDVSAALGNREKGVQELTAGLDKTIVVGCEGGSEQSIESALQAVGEEPHVIITCTQVQEGSAGTPQAVAAELQQLQEAHDAVAALNKRQLTVYAVQPDASALVQQRRRLQSSNADVGVCGQLCQTQVKWLEGILAAFILTLAAFSGMCCLYMLDTPTRFEKPKEGTSRAE